MEPPVSRIGWSNQKIEATRYELDKAKVIMKANVQKMMERQGKLDDLVDRAQRLEAASDEYVKCAVKIERKMNWKKLYLQYSIVGASAILSVVGMVWALVG